MVNVKQRDRVTSLEIYKMDSIQAWVAGAVLLLLVLLTVFMVLNWREIKLQRRSTESLLAEVRLDRRAWMAISPPLVKDFPLDKPIPCVIGVHNNGKTPADIVLTNMTVITIQVDKDISSFDDLDRAKAEQIPVMNNVPPGGTFYFSESNSPVMNEGLLAQIAGGQMKLFVFGSCLYRDVIEKKLRTTKYCFQWSTSAEKWYSHNKGNYMD